MEYAWICLSSLKEVQLGKRERGLPNCVSDFLEWVV